MTSKIQELRRDFSFDSKSKMVLLLSFATDEMIKEVQKNPEVWFMDVTSGANIQKRDLFIMVVRKPDGTCFMGNVTLIPSGKVQSMCNIYCSVPRANNVYHNRSVVGIPANYTNNFS
jgi:hypothetical protein